MEIGNSQPSAAWEDAVNEIASHPCGREALIGTLISQLLPLMTPEELGVLVAELATLLDAPLRTPPGRPVLRFREAVRIDRLRRVAA